MADIATSMSYTPVNTLAQEIRVLLLQPWKEPDLIECDMFVLNLDSKPAYEALSYEWGASDADTRHISVDGRTKTVRQNLWSALYHLRLRDGPRLLWIDALCINQDNVIERNHQVTLMGRIYSQSRRVVAWLGPENDHNAKALGGQVEIALAFLYKRIAPNNPWYEAAGEAFVDLCSRTYWNRLWIVQEIILAQSVLVQCGAATFDFDVFRQLHSTGANLSSSLGADEVRSFWKIGPVRLITLQKTRSYALENPALPSGYSSPLTLMQEVSHSHCQDIRDRIFGLLSLSPDCCRTAIHPNYSQTLIEVCETLLDHLLSNHYKPIDITMRGILNGLGLNYQKIVGERWPRPLSFITSLKCAQGSELATFRNTYKGRVAWVFEPADDITPSSAAYIPHLPFLEEGALLYLAELLATETEAVHFSATEPVEGEQLYFNPESTFASIPKESRSYATEPRHSSYLLSQSGTVRPLTPPDSWSSLFSETLWSNWRQFVSNIVGSLKSQRLSLFLTGSGSVGVATRACQVGDLLCNTGTGIGRVALLGYLDGRHVVIGKGLILYERGFVESVDSQDIDLHIDLATYFFLHGYF